MQADNSKTLIWGSLETWKKDNPRIDDMMSSEQGALLSRAYETLDTSVLYKSRLHGVGHIERTMLMGALLARAIALTPHESEMLLFCCAYHDIGRGRGGTAEEHGSIASELLSKPEMKAKTCIFNAEDILIIKAAIALHSMSDSELDNTAKKFSISAGNMDRYCRIAKCLKDSDNLDRVRLSDLDTDYLRHQESIELAADAQWVFDRYDRP